MVILSKKQQIKRIKQIMSKPEFITCENGHNYLPMSKRAETICPLCKDNFNYDNNDFINDDVNDFIFYFNKNLINPISE